MSDSLFKQYQPHDRYNKLDIVRHGTFGDGVVLIVSEGSITVAFQSPHGKKKLVHNREKTNLTMVKKEDRE